MRPQRRASGRSRARRSCCRPRSATAADQGANLGAKRKVAVACARPWIIAARLAIAPAVGAADVVLERRFVGFARGRDGAARERVGALVLGMAGVALDPAPMHLVSVQRLVEALPQVDVLDRLLVGGAPAVLLPI